jgi:CMP-2-keto-3-deoxyoctulosonic acid synthetase
MEKTIKDSNADIIIITDVRFDNEAEFVKGIDGYGIVVNITRDNHSQIKDSNHASEQGIKDSLKDRVVVNIDGNPFIAAASVLGIILNAYYTSTGQISKLVVAG